MEACKVEYSWGKWNNDTMKNEKKYFPTVEKALEFCENTLLHHKSWRIIQNGIVVQTIMGKILGKPLMKH